MVAAYICKLACGRWVVVTNDTEARADYFVDRIKMYTFNWAKVAAYKRNLKQWGQTVFVGDVPESLIQEFEEKEAVLT